MNTLGIVITDGVGFRNFVMSHFLGEAAQSFDQVVVYSGLPTNCYPKLSFLNVTIKELPVFEEPKSTWFFRKWKEIAHLQKFRSIDGMRDNLESGYPKNNSARSILIKVIYFFTKKIHSNISILWAEQCQFWSFSKHKTTKNYIQLLNQDKPSQLFFSHQRPTYLTPFLYAAICQKIPTSTFIFSWDNLASKGRMMGAFDRFLVWSDLMKTELHYFYPNVNLSQIHVVGTPQFEPYTMQEYETQPEAFFEKFALDAHKKTICYSCADASIGANDTVVIKIIADAIRQKKINHNVQFLVRTSPAEDESRFLELKKAYPEIFWNFPKWVLTRENHAENWSQRIPTSEDIQDLRAMLSHVNLNINMCSTMSLDCMLFDKPVINTVFGNQENGLYDDQRFLKYAHYKRVVESQSVCIAKNEFELLAQINENLTNPGQRSKARKAMIDIQIGKPIAGTSNRIVASLSSFRK